MMSGQETVSLSGLDLQVLSGALLEVTHVVRPDNLIASVKDHMALARDLDQKISRWNAALLASHRADREQNRLAWKMTVPLTCEERLLLCAIVENAILDLDIEFETRVGVTVAEAQLALDRLRGAPQL